MGTINVTLGDATQLNLPLGRQLENDVTEVVFDFSAWNTTYGAGTLSLSVQRKGDEMPYPVTMTVSGTDATWEVTDTDTARKGVGKAQLTYTVGDAVKKSVIYKFTVYESLGVDGEYPAPGSDWMEEMEQEIADVKTDLAEYEDIFTADVGESVSNWLDLHPEATTTVQDGSITIPKLNNDVKSGLNIRTIFVSDFSGSDDNEILQNAIDEALSMESCTLIIDKTLNITDTINIIFTNSAVQALTIQGMFKNVRSSGNVFHGDANPTLRNNMIGVINCDVDGVVFNVKSRNDTPELCVRDCIFYNNSENTSDTTNGRIWENNTMTLFYVVGTVCNFVNNTVVGFDYFINAPSTQPSDSSKANWTGDFGIISKNTIYTCGHGISMAYQDCTDISGNAFIGMYGCTQYLFIHVAHGITIRNNMFGPFMNTIPITMETGITLRSCNALIYNNHGENSKASYVFFIADSGTAVFIANQWTTTISGRILYNSGTSKVFFEGNSFDTTPLTQSTATLIDCEDIKNINSAIDVLNYSYIATADDWDSYKSNKSFYFDGVTTVVRSGYPRGFFESKFSKTGTLGTQVITWLDGKKSTRAYTYGTFGEWYTES